MMLLRALLTTGCWWSEALSLSLSETSSDFSSLLPPLLGTCLLVPSDSNGFPAAMALPNLCTSSSSCANSRRSRILVACSVLSRPFIPRSLSILRMCVIWELTSRPLSSLDHILCTPHALTRAFSSLTFSSSFERGCADFFAREDFALDFPGSELADFLRLFFIGSSISDDTSESLLFWSGIWCDEEETLGFVSESSASESLYEEISSAFALRSRLCGLGGRLTVLCN